VTGPKVADAALHVAAASTVAAPSLLATVQTSFGVNFGGASSVAGSGPPNTVTKVKETIDYQAPDRVLVNESGSSSAGGSSTPTVDRLTQIGSSCWETPPAPGSLGQQACNNSAISGFFNIVQSLESASGVSFRDGTYYLSRSASLRVINSIGGTGNELTSADVKSVSVQAQVHGDSISWESLSYTVSESAPAGIGSAPGGGAFEESVQIAVRFTEIGSAPPVNRPAGPPTSTG
jgi:hypothetical protein